MEDFDYDFIDVTEVDPGCYANKHNVITKTMHLLLICGVKQGLKVYYLNDKCKKTVRRAFERATSSSSSSSSSSHDAAAGESVEEEEVEEEAAAAAAAVADFITPFMKFSSTLTQPDNALYTIYDGFNQCYYNIDINAQALQEVTDPGILEAVIAHLQHRSRDSCCQRSMLLLKYLENYKTARRGEVSVHIGAIDSSSSEDYDIVVNNHSWSIIKYLLNAPSLVFYSTAEIKEQYPLLPSSKHRVVRD